MAAVLRFISADIVCLQETKFTKADMKDIQQLTNVPGW